MREQTPLSPIFWSKVLGGGPGPAPSGTISISANGTYDVAAFAEAEVEVPISSGGVQLIASGTFTGTGSYIIDVPVGKKMPHTNFIFNCWVDGGTTITPKYDVSRITVIIQVLVQKRFCGYDLSTNGNKYLVSKLTYPTVGSDGTTVTNRRPDASCKTSSYVRTTTIATELFGIGFINRASTGFTIHIERNSQYLFENGITYNWEVLYIGSDPANDIVEVA